MSHALKASRGLRGLAAASLLGLSALLAACSSAPKMPDPTPLAPVPPILHVSSTWSSHVGAVPASFQAAVAGSHVVVASADGDVLSLDAGNGAQAWRTHIDGGITAAAGSDGLFTAVVDAHNRVVSLGPQGQVLWRYQLPASVTTPPAVFGGTVVVLGADQHLWAFDAATGAKRWDDELRAPALLLEKGSGFVLQGGALVFGDANGQLRAVRLSDGAELWSVALARPAGVTEVERLIAITGTPAVAQGVVCARAYQAAVGCADLADGRVSWTARSDGADAVSQNGDEVVATQADGTVQAYAVADGKPRWHNDQLKYRRLSAPLLAGHTVAVGDLEGYVSFLDANDGQIVGRVATDGSRIASPMVLSGSTLVVVTRNGGVYGFVPR